MNPRLILPAVLISLAACAPPKQEQKPRETGPAAAIPYDAIGANVGKRVSFKAWVLGEGDSYRSTGDPPQIFYILVPEPQADWGVVGEAEEIAKKLLADLEAGDPQGPAGSDMVYRFNRCSQSAGAFSAMLKKEEQAPGVAAWGVFPRQPLSGEYGLDASAGTPYLANPTRQQLKDAASAVNERIQRLLESAELQVIGTPETADSWIAAYGEGGESLKNAIRTKQFVVKVDTFKTLRTGRDLAELAKLKRKAGEVK